MTSRTPARTALGVAAVLSEAEALSAGCVMDFPTAFAWVAEHHPSPADHDPKCSYATHGMLCDCHLLMDEYARRKSVATPTVQRGVTDTDEARALRALLSGTAPK